MSGTADDRYFEWLYSHIGPVTYNNPDHTYWSITRQLYKTVFTWHIRNDQNRAEDGLALREVFIDETGDPGDITLEWLNLPCSVFEMMIALSDRLAFESYGDTGAWFWKMMENLHLDRYTDRLYTRHVEDEVTETLYCLVNRDYGMDGTGGLFPLRESRRDQRRVELWYQKEAYLLEGLRIPNGPHV